MSRCLDDDDCAAFVEGELGESGRRRVEEHLERCAACRELVFAVGRLGHEGPAAPGVGSRLGDYRIVGWVGQGAQGRVFEAEDTKLGRRVALKFLDGPAGSPGAALAEARRVAAVDHPNVLTVFEVHEHAETPFLVTEYLEGQPLMAWIRVHRPRPEVLLRRLLAVGRGLSAVHEAGLVHRDVKPDNVRVTRRAMVLTDFGLATTCDGRTDPSKPRAIAGTPRYMAPEQRRGECEASSDQYAFAAMVRDALDANPQRLSGVRRRRIDRALAVALRDDPSRRYPSMAALLERLRAASSARTRRWLGVAAFSVAGAGLWAVGRPAAPPVCHRVVPSAQVEGPRTSLLDREHLDRINAGLDGLAKDWTQAVAELCNAEHPEASAVSACLDRSADSIEAVGGTLASRTEIELAVVGVASVVPPSMCLEAPERYAPPTLDDSADARHEREALERALSARDVGETSKARRAATEVLQSAEASGSAQRQADALLVLGQVELAAGRLDTARAHLLEAVERAESGHSVLARAEAYLHLASLAHHQRDLDAAAGWARSGLATVEGHRGAEILQASLNNVLGVVETMRGNYEAARSAYALVKRLLPPSHPGQARADSHLSVVLRRLGQEQAALELARSAAEHDAEVLGPRHLASLLSKAQLAAAIGEQGDHEGARDMLVEVVEAMRARTPPPAELAGVRQMLGHAHRELGELEEARVQFAGCRELADAQGNETLAERCESGLQEPTKPG